MANSAKEKDEHWNGEKDYILLFKAWNKKCFYFIRYAVFMAAETIVSQLRTYDII